MQQLFASKLVINIYLNLFRNEKFNDTGLTSFGSHLTKLTALNNLSLDFYWYTFINRKKEITKGSHHS